MVNAYAFTFAGFLLLGGRAADLLGRGRIFITGLAIFTLIGGLAESGTWLIMARAAQGIGGAILAPATLSILVTTFTDPHDRRRALGAWSAAAASGAAVGVLAGGVLTSLLSWRWVLIVNVPIGTLLLVGAWLTLPRSEPQAPRRTLDLTGAVTVTAGLAVLVYGIISTDATPWGSARTVVTLATALVLLSVFFVNEARFAKDPLIPLSIFSLRSLSAANGIAFMLGAAIGPPGPAGGSNRHRAETFASSHRSGTVTSHRNAHLLQACGLAVAGFAAARRVIAAGVYRRTGGTRAGRVLAAA